MHYLLKVRKRLISLQEQTNPQTIIEIINNWANNILEFLTNLKQNSPAVFLFLICILPFIYRLCIEPAIQDIFKEKVLHVSEFPENKPQENAKQIKTSLEKDFGIALDTINKVRVTNRETPVFQSHQRISGTIDKIPYNKPEIIIEKKRNWSFVMYTNSIGEEMSGWVFTGNLAK
ncbi:hypothetical protein P5770_19820 [Bacillus cereus]|uniref:hypothetical protein n=1 Tax=Bacillus cereus TaxID=1396 RepID=UPI002405DAAE|nr:hypothetical protein [Bacillus cereus]MDF9478962.1 hypothetical protein [Bacillus cereus]MDF9500541.1 hypothetical protein [Bacillus cereus]MDF9518339.1 hypothetical protein [Bacillus cereus]MDF9569682.1 hypothetical protein [Bacillus cereus]